MSITVGKNGINREVSKVYIGKNGINLESKDIYIGNNGVNKIVYQNIKPYTITNLVTNGDFTYDDVKCETSYISSWGRSGEYSLYGDYSLYMQPKYENPSFLITSEPEIQYNKDSLYFISYWIFNRHYYINENAKCEFQMRNNYNFSTPPKMKHLKAREWLKYSCIIKCNNAYKGHNIGVLMYLDENTKKIEYYFDAFILVDLTSSFGKGNEPTEDWCNKNLPSYFEGSQIIYK